MQPTGTKSARIGNPSDAPFSMARFHASPNAPRHQRPGVIIRLMPGDRWFGRVAYPRRWGCDAQRTCLLRLMLTPEAAPLDPPDPPHEPILPWPSGAQTSG
jgi:hypothetical protein